MIIWIQIKYNVLFFYKLGFGKNYFDWSKLYLSPIKLLQQWAYLTQLGDLIEPV